MKQPSNLWTENDLKAYLLIYGANANFKEASEEIELIRSKISKERFDRIHEEWKHDNDAQGIEKMRSAMQRFGYDQSKREQLLDELQALFQSDGKYDILERNMFKGIRRILIT